MEEKLISAIITTHNRPPEQVLRAVRSVLRQTYPHTELIVVDDSSADYPLRNAVEQAVRQASGSIRYIRHPDSRGSCAARNTGLSHANGYYAAFLDDDDEWLPEKLAEQIKGFSGSQTALVYCQQRMIDRIRKLTYIAPPQMLRGAVFHSLLKTNFIGSTSNPLIKKECLEQIGGFDTKMQSMQDYDVWLRLAARYPVNYVRKPLLKYYIHENTRISSDTDKKLSGLLRLNAKYSKYIRQDSDTWYLRHIVLTPLLSRMESRRCALAMWLQCVRKCPCRIVDHTKFLLVILAGCDSLPYRFYEKMKFSRIAKQRVSHSISGGKA